MTGYGIALAKTAMRREARARRGAVTQDARAPAAEAAAARAIAFLAALPGPSLRGAVVAATLPIGTEIDPRPLMRRLAEVGARIAVPAIEGDRLRFRDLAAGAALEPQGFGTVAPGAKAAELRPAILLLPLLAFDRAGGRLGYGGGFYDRALARLGADGGPRPLAVGLAFAVQEVAAVPAEPHDRPLDAVVTESEVLVPSAMGRAPGPPR